MCKPLYNCVFCNKSLIYVSTIDEETEDYIYRCESNICNGLASLLNFNLCNQIIDLNWNKPFVNASKLKVRYAGIDCTFTTKTIRATLKKDRDLAMCMILRNVLLMHCRTIEKVKHST